MQNQQSAPDGPSFSYGYKRTAKDFTLTFNFSFEALAVLVFATVLVIIGIAHACNRQPAPATVEQQAPNDKKQFELGYFPVAASNPAPSTAPTPTPKKSKPTVKNINFSGVEGVERYIKRFQVVAILEMEKYDIPASISMAQGLLESQIGSSELSRKYHNHFGIKCHARSCKPGHCVNYKDDSHKDFFRTFTSAWESWRAHSLLLQGERYAHLKGQPYRKFAHGLKKAGYATDKNYARKIIALIERYDLTRLDRGVKFQ